MNKSPELALLDRVFQDSLKKTEPVPVELPKPKPADPIIIKDEATWREFWGNPEEKEALKPEQLVDWLPDSLSVKKLYADLDYWLLINIADDIVSLPDQRKEFSRLVKVVQKVLPDCPKDDIPKWVLRLISYQLERPLIFRQTFYWLVWLRIKKLFSKLH